MNKVLITTLSWNRCTYTKRLLETLLNNTNTSVDFIIVDNGSADSTINFLKTIENKKTKNGSTIRIHYNNRNLGVSEGLNIGLSYRLPEQHFMKLDNDMIIPNQPEWLNEMIEIIELSKPIDNVKIIGLSPFDPNRYEHYQRRPVDLSNNKSYMVEDPGPNGILGCGELIHKDVFDKIKKFEAFRDGKPVLYGYEDINFAKKAFNLGFRSVYHFQCKAIHGDYLDLPESQNQQEFKHSQLIRTTFNKPLCNVATVDTNINVEFV